MDKFKTNYDGDILTLVKMVEERPCIWDKSCVKEPGERKRAWKEICRYFQEDFDEMEADEQAKFEHFLSGKWHNLRDTFTKMVKKRCEEKYKYYENLKFVMKNIDVDKAQSSPSLKQPVVILSPLEQEPLNKSKKSLATNRIKRSSPSLTVRLAQKRRRLSIVPKPANVIPPAPLETPKKELFPKIAFKKPLNATPVLHQKARTKLDEDDAFFISIMPNVKKLSDEQKLEFRMGVLSTIKEISQKSKAKNSSSMCSGLLFVTQDEYSDDAKEDDINVTD